MNPDGISFIGLADDADAATLLTSRGADPAAYIDSLRERLHSTDGVVGVIGSRAWWGSLGWWGWLGYEAGSEALGVPSAEAETPNAAFMFVDRGLQFDHGTRTVHLISLNDAPGRVSWLDETERSWKAGATDPQGGPAALGGSPGLGEPIAPGAATSFSWRHDRADYLAMIEECQAAITRGDAYQICLTNTIDVDLGRRPNPLDVYLRMRALSPTSYGGLLRMGSWSLLSGSPEQFLRVDATGRAMTRPIKGTRRRGKTQKEDDALIAALLGSEKERAENLMIVDLMRNDLSRVSRVGSVEVAQLFTVESYPNVHQLVSTVESDLVVDGLAATVALFPPGSMTGAPKISAMTILAKLEKGPRGIYAGVWGSFAIDGSVDLAVVIRSIVMRAGRATIGTGGGITALSDPQDEWDEIVLKAAPALKALGLHP